MDCLIIGAGLTGAAIARELAGHGHRVRVWDRRPQAGGNMHDFVDGHGIRVHQYGPHCFHTKKKALFDYVRRFAKWQDYRLRCGAEIDGKVTPTPFSFRTVDDYFPPEQAKRLKQELRSHFGGREHVGILELLGCERPAIRGYAEFLFRKDYAPYTAKQWGIPPEEVDPSVLRRVPVRLSYGEDYFDDAWQALPCAGYADFFRSLLGHPDISVELGIEALGHLSIDEGKRRVLLDGAPCPVPVVYTGALDELFRMDRGRLPYRSLRFEWHHERVGSKQPYAVVAYPQAGGFTRITEYTKMPVQQAEGTAYAVEYPLPYLPGRGKEQEPYYPLLTADSQRQYAIYRERAERIEGLHFCGRLADFKYYNMDQALERALCVSERILRQE